MKRQVAAGCHERRIQLHRGVVDVDPFLAAGAHVELCKAEVDAVTVNGGRCTPTRLPRVLDVAEAEGLNDAPVIRIGAEVDAVPSAGFAVSRREDNALLGRTDRGDLPCITRVSNTDPGAGGELDPHSGNHRQRGSWGP